MQSGLTIPFKDVHNRNDDIYRTIASRRWIYHAIVSRRRIYRAIAPRRRVQLRELPLALFSDFNAIKPFNFSHFRSL